MARGRPRQFDEDRVLGKAAVLFRERGYAATSMQALSEAMEMGEQSIYNAFGSKEGVFQSALDHYASEAEGFFKTLAAPGASRAAIEAFFEVLIEVMSGDTPPCLVAQTCLAHGNDGSDAARKATKHMRKVEAHFHKAIVNAVEQGESHSEDPRTAARFLNMTMVGLGVMARSGASKRALRKMADLALQVLD